MSNHFDNGLHIVEEQFKNFMSGFRMTENPNGKPMKLGIVFSGGLDSSVLLDVACKYRDMFNYTVSLIYISVELFGRDNSVCDNLAVKLANNYKTDIMFDICPVSNRATPESARNLIRNKLKEVVFSKEFDVIMTGYNSDDQFEQVLFNFFRGCNVEELTGHKFTSVWKNNEKTRIVGRPFLNLDTNQLLDYARYNRLFFINSEPEFDIDICDSSFIKENILPKIVQRFNPDAIRKTLSNISKYVTERNEPVIDIRIVDGFWYISEFIRLPIGNRVYVVREYFRQVLKTELSEEGVSILRKRLEEDLTDLYLHLAGFVLTIRDNVIVVENPNKVSTTA